MNHMALRAARERRDWTMEQLAKLAGINKGTISRLESGDIENPSNDTVRKLEEALRVRRGTLVFGQAREARAS